MDKYSSDDDRRFENIADPRVGELRDAQDSLAHRELIQNPFPNSTKELFPKSVSLKTNEVRHKAETDAQNLSGQESEGQKESLKKQKSADYDASVNPNAKYVSRQARDKRQNDGYKLQRAQGSHPSSSGSTKDRDNSNSDSVGSNSSGLQDGADHDDGTFMADDVEQKTYMIKTSGTIVDVASRKRKKMRKIPMSVKKPVSQYVAFIKSPFKGRAPTMFYPYPAYVGEKKEEFGRVFFKPQDDLGPLVMRFKISETTNIYNAIVNGCKNAGMHLVGERLMLKKKRIAQGYDTSSSDEDDYDEDPNECNIVFSGSLKEENVLAARGYQKLNHFPESSNLGKKDAMWKNYLELHEQFPDDFDFCPRTYVFPDDADDFDESRNDPNYDPDTDIKLWIFKPSNASCGKGIRIISRDSPIPTAKKGFVISEYISNPHLIEGLKYDLRVYVLVTSYDPLIIHLYDDGLARFATEKYTLDEDHFENRFVHLTNYSIQKKAEAYSQNKTKGSSNLRASKWSLKTLQKVFEDHNKDYKTIKNKMKDLIIKTIISVEPPIVEAMERRPDNKDIYYELYGFDIIIDSNLKPWILEVNVSPSFSSSSPFDKNIKTKLICDVLTLVGIKPTNHAKYMKEEEKKAATKVKKPAKDIKSISPDKIDEDDYELIMYYEEQIRRSENFELIFPVKRTFKKYVKFFNKKRYNNYLLWNHIKDPLIDIGSLLN